jgi:transcriptional repressor NrdR
MKCPVCGKKAKVIDVREVGNRIKRRRECTSCLTRFNTFEGLDYTSIPEWIRRMGENE